jgi:hypothetical protein
MGYLLCPQAWIHLKIVLNEIATSLPSFNMRSLRVGAGKIYQGLSNDAGFEGAGPFHGLNKQFWARV